jgi:hypothetical protein
MFVVRTVARWALWADIRWEDEDRRRTKWDNLFTDVPIHGKTRCTHRSMAELPPTECSQIVESDPDICSPARNNQRLFCDMRTKCSGGYKEEVRGGWRKLHHEHRRDLYS